NVGNQTGKQVFDKLAHVIDGVDMTFRPYLADSQHVRLRFTAGRGYYQEWGAEPVELHPGDVVNVPAGVKHWHGAASDSWFTHIAIAVPGEGLDNEWLEPVADEDYDRLG
ncbi:cupin domain-containing protein, partial [Propionibacterium acidifaciens]|uniref:cupin domain-containing protein n=1 Tax=Propionibacterium acidifaciens TaxID=556499 RepID=UPI00362043FF